ncbi:unnamed protein product [Microthlaspi erraticum]|uniref:CCHC-type domain-containing protein n=1 Tax=Microthlaspi erraticum TaxID=1685480 RepID=A0A6D2IF65_9BRAS|nr:unnamed protein product [Microthlaspi erraticum]
MLKKGKSSAEGLYVENRGRSKKRNDGKDKGKTKDQGGRSKSRNKNGKKGTCFICGKEGHWKRECPMRGQKQNESSSVNTVAEIKQPLVLTVSSQYTKDEWVMDSGCTFHITPNKEYMPDMSRNLISYGMLEKSGCTYTGENYKVTFFKDGQKVITGKYKDGLYFLQGTVSKGDVNVIDPKNN